MASALLLRLNEMSSRVFGTVFNPTNARTGLKFLRRKMAGPHLLAYHPPEYERLFRLDESYEDSDAEYWRDKALRLRQRGKGPPKKGQGKRATIKNKKK